MRGVETVSKRGPRVEFIHRFDPNAGSVTVLRSGGSFPSRLIILGPDAEVLLDRLHHVMSGFDHYPQFRSPDVCEMTRTRDTDWGKCIPLIKQVCEQSGFEFVEKTPEVKP